MKHPRRKAPLAMANRASAEKLAAMDVAPMGVARAMDAGVSAVKVRGMKHDQKVGVNVRIAAAKAVPNCAALKVRATNEKVRRVSAVDNAPKVRLVTVRRSVRPSAPHALLLKTAPKLLQQRPDPHATRVANAVKKAIAPNAMIGLKLVVRHAVKAVLKRVPTAAMAVDHEAQKDL